MVVVWTPKSTACTSPTRHLGVSVRSRAHTLPVTCAHLPSPSSSSASVVSLSHTQSATPVRHFDKHLTGKKRIYFLDVNPLCFNGSRPCMKSFAYWVGLFFSKVSHRDPVIAVLDGEGGNEFRRHLLPSYKAGRQSNNGSSDGWLNRVEPQIVQILQSCNVPVVKIKGFEADDVVATLMDQALEYGYPVMIGSPDKDFKQLISNDVQIAMPVPELRRWCFYNMQHYIKQYGCDPTSDLSLRCFMGDEVDGVPGLQKLVPSFGRKTAIKLLKKHGSLENLLNAAAVRIVGRDYAQDALTKYADYLRRNYQVLSLRRDASIQLEENWLCERDSSNDSLVLSKFVQKLSQGRDVVRRSGQRVKSTA
ncbi:5'-3' exonuclease [Rhynchospora pubera]|uniref:5'-3' exonuclease n=1 Tax=Rhynchospora pubera TaxID=906938 RepID=A0AAV8G1K3_9POAL|nr:5'-3' exonuclease [Rhynchospora pubera]KAJ4799483.1 5'-3' exonuclease [Rhynchospora pubera]